MKILVIDDEPLVRRALVRALKSKKHTLLEAENGKEGLLLWKKESPDLVFLDVLMPELSGTDVLLSIDKNNTKIILMTAHAGEKMIDEVIMKKVDLYLQKPFENIFEVVAQAEKLCQ